MSYHQHELLKYAADFNRRIDKLQQSLDELIEGVNTNTKVFSDLLQELTGIRPEFEKPSPPDNQQSMEMPS
jgi:two-component sensor histidine kinase